MLKLQADAPCTIAIITPPKKDASSTTPNKSSEIINTIVIGLLHGAIKLRVEGNPTEQGIMFDELSAGILVGLEQCQESKATNFYIKSKYGDITFKEEDGDVIISCNENQATFKDYSFYTLQHNLITNIIASPAYYSTETFNTAVEQYIVPQMVENTIIQKTIQIIQHPADNTSEHVQEALMYVQVHPDCFDNSIIQLTQRINEVSRIIQNPGTDLIDTIQEALQYVKKHSIYFSAPVVYRTNQILSSSHIVQNNDLYTADEIQKALLYVASRQQYFVNEDILKAMEQIMNIGTGDFSPPFINSVANYIIRNPHRFSPLCIKQAAHHFIQHSKCGQKMGIDEAIPHIVCNSPDYTDDLVKCAVFSIVISSQNYSLETIDVVKEYVTKRNDDSYAPTVAQLFIRSNLDFFNEAVFHQDKFKAFFENVGKLPLLEEYSTGLSNALISNPSIFLYGQYGKRALYNLWIKGNFIKALELDSGKYVTNFMLEKMAHGAIRLWNSKDTVSI